MMRGLLLALALVGCTKAAPPAPAPTQAAVAPPAPAPAPPPPPAKAASVELTAVTLADDCGGTPPYGAPAAVATPPPAAKEAVKAKADSPMPPRGGYAKRRCEQTSMQLSITAADAATIKVKSVELFDESGKSLGALTPSLPTKWSDASSTYETWDEAIAKDSTSSVSYVLSQPSWATIGDRYNKSFTLKTVITVGGVDAQSEKSFTLRAPSSLPPGVKT